VYQLLKDLYHLFRLSAFGATALLPLLGAASADRRLDGRRVIGLLGVAAAFHAFAYLHNDLCDLELDRTQPLRADYPLVRGSLTPRTVRVLALTALPVAFALDTLVAAPDRANARRTRLAAAILLLAAYNRWGKSCPFPPLTDLIQALGWTSLIGYGAAATGHRDTRLVSLLSGYELLLIMQVNAIHGALRDLANDYAQGARTTAIWLGARPQPGGGMSLPPAMAIYALSLQAALLLLPMVGVGAVPDEAQPRVRRRVAVGVVLITALQLIVLAMGARRRARPADVGMLHLILILSAPIALVGPGMAPAPRSMLLLAHLLPLLANGRTYAALRWALSLPQDPEPPSG